jgi:hypothetical protein
MIYFPNLRLSLCIFLLLSFSQQLLAQKVTALENSVYIDNKGVLRWVNDDKEANFFGVNYTVPFAWTIAIRKESR